MRKKTHYEYVAEAKKSGIEVLETYVNSATKIKHKHTKCGYEWSTAPNNISSRKSSCPKCAGKIINNYKPKEGYEALELYINTETKILHRHIICGYEWKVSPHDLRKIKTCPACRLIKRTHEEYVNFAATKDLEVLEEYTRASDKILHKHSCGYIWYTLPQSILVGSSCPNCANKKSNFLYVCYFKDLDLYKIGITNNWNVRKLAFGYVPKLLNLVKFTDQNSAYKAEQFIINSLAQYKYNTGRLRSGNTETFKLPKT